MESREHDSSLQGAGAAAAAAAATHMTSARRGFAGLGATTTNELVAATD